MYISVTEDLGALAYEMRIVAEDDSHDLLPSTSNLFLARDHYMRELFVCGSFNQIAKYSCFVIAKMPKIAIKDARENLVTERRGTAIKLILTHAPDSYITR